MSATGTQRPKWYWTAFQLPLNFFATPRFVIGMIAIGVLVLMLWVRFCLLVNLWLAGGTLIGLGVAVFLLSKLQVKKWGGRILVIREVPRMRELVLRWRQSSNGARDENAYHAISPGLAGFCPWFWQVEGEVSMEPFVIPLASDKLHQINAGDGTQIEVDVQTTAWVVDSVLFVMNLANNPVSMTKAIMEYEHTALEWATSVNPNRPENGSAASSPPPRVILIDPSTGNCQTESVRPDGSRHCGFDISALERRERVGGTSHEDLIRAHDLRTVDGWWCDTISLTNMNDRQMAGMGKAISHWMNHWLMSSGEQRFGIAVKIKITQFLPSRIIRAAQDARTAKNIQVEEAVAEAEGQARVAAVMLQQAWALAPQEVKDSVAPVVMAMIDFTRTPEQRDEAAQRLAAIMGRFMPNPTLFMSLVTALPQIQKIAELILGGRLGITGKVRTSASSEGE